MKTNVETQELPTELARLADQPRVLVRRGGAPRNPAKCIVYWMQRAMRIQGNPALDVAIEAANILGLPVVRLSSESFPNYPNANLRHYHFLRRACAMWPKTQPSAASDSSSGARPTTGSKHSSKRSQAALLIGDENPCREPERWRNVLARRLEVPFWTVDADVIVPSRVFGRSFVLLHHFRPRLKAELPKLPGRDARRCAAARMEAAKSAAGLPAHRRHHRRLSQAGPHGETGGHLYRRNTRRAEAPQ